MWRTIHQYSSEFCYNGWIPSDFFKGIDLTNYRKSHIMKETKQVEHPQLMGKLLEQMGRNIKLDIRANRGVDYETGKYLDDGDYSLIHYDSKVNPKTETIPNYKQDGRLFWQAYYKLPNNRFDPLRDLFNGWVRNKKIKKLEPYELMKQLWPEIAFSELDRYSINTVILGLVARTYHEGVSLHHMPIFKSSNQGIGKSLFVQSLLPERYMLEDFPMTGISGLKGFRETAEMTEGIAIIEVPEIGGVKQADADTWKRLLSKTRISSVRKYRAEREDIPIRFIMIGTTNSDKPIPHDHSGQSRRMTVINLDDAPRLEANEVPKFKATIENARPRIYKWAYKEMKKRIKEKGSIWDVDLCEQSREVRYLHRLNTEKYMIHRDDDDPIGQAIKDNFPGSYRVA